MLVGYTYSAINAHSCRNSNEYTMLDKNLPPRQHEPGWPTGWGSEWKNPWRHNCSKKLCADFVAISTGSIPASISFSLSVILCVEERGCAMLGKRRTSTIYFLTSWAKGKRQMKIHFEPKNTHLIPGQYTIAMTFSVVNSGYVFGTLMCRNFGSSKFLRNRSQFLSSFRKSISS